MGEDKEWEVATPMDWHYNAHQSEVVTSDGKTKVWIWDLPPAAAHYALEELAMARTKRRELLQGIIVIPNLLTPEWTRRLSKTVDIYFRIPAGSLPGWPNEMHESLTIGLLAEKVWTPGHSSEIAFHFRRPEDWACCHRMVENYFHSSVFVDKYTLQYEYCPAWSLEALLST